MERSSQSRPELSTYDSPRIVGSIPSNHRIFQPTARLDPVLRKARFFRGLSDLETSSVLREAVLKHYATNSVVTEQGDPADRLFLLLKGSGRHSVLTTDGRKVNLFWLVPGDIFGGACLLSEAASFIVRTELAANSQVLMWKRQAVRLLATRFTRLLDNGLSIANDYLVWYLATHLSLTCHTARERLAHVLVSLSGGIGQKCAAGVSLDITNEQLANTANVTTFTVSRLLNQWRRNGSISKSRGQVLIRRPEELFSSNSSSQSVRLKGPGR
jgi:CRP/FNR family transcriptional regulator, nitrogen oxide reductase regulator